MVKANSSLALKFEVGGGAQVGQVGLWMLGGFADRLGVGTALGEAYGSSGVVHDRGRLLVHLMLVLAGGGEAVTDIEVLRSQPGLFGDVASDSTLYRTLTQAGEGRRRLWPGRWPRSGSGYGLIFLRAGRWCWISIRRFMSCTRRTKRAPGRLTTASTDSIRCTASRTGRGSRWRLCYGGARRHRTR